MGADKIRIKELEAEIKSDKIQIKKLKDIINKAGWVLRGKK